MANSVPVCSKKSVKPVQTSDWTSISIDSYKVGQKPSNKIRKIFEY